MKRPVRTYRAFLHRRRGRRTGHGPKAKHPCTILGAALPFVDLAPTQPLAVVAATGTTCARMHDLSVRCWGAGGALGLGDTITRGDHPGEMGANLPPVDLGGPAELLYTRNGGACVRLVGGALKCWGLNNVGQLGLGDVDRRGDEPGEMGDALPPVELGAGRTALEVAGRSLSTCARLDDGTVKCWGYNSSGQLGQGDTEHRGDHPGEMGDALPPIALF